MRIKYLIKNTLGELKELPPGIYKTRTLEVEMKEGEYYNVIVEVIKEIKGVQK